MGEEHEGGYASTSDEHRRQGDSVIRVITAVFAGAPPSSSRGSPFDRRAITWLVLMSLLLKDGGEVEISGSPTEKAILSWAYKLGMKFDTIRSESAIIHAFPFNSGKKRGGVAVLRVTS